MRKILFFQWNAFMQKGIERAFTYLGMEYDTFYYIFKDWDKDDDFKEKFKKRLQSGKEEYEYVFSVNFSPLISEVCKDLQVKYVSWIYDCPLHIRNKEPMKYSCNTIFFFDRIEAENYRNKGVNAYHLPLAGDTVAFTEKYKYVDMNMMHNEEKGIYTGFTETDMCDVSLVGKLYHSDYAYLLRPLDGYCRGYLEGVVEAQRNVYGGCFIGDCLSDSFIERINASYLSATNGEFKILREELEYAVGTEITGRERYMALALLQNRCNVSLFSSDKDERLQKVVQPGYVDYYTQMPQVFKKSRINLNISLKLIQSGVPLRVFDVLASGGFLMTNFQPEIVEMFVPGEELVVYENMQDLVEKSIWYLEHDEERKRIASNGYEKVKNTYTFENCISHMFAKLH